MAARILKFPQTQCAPDEPPVLPGRLADLFGGAGHWQRPDYADLVPLRAEIDYAAAAFARALDPAPEPFMRDQLETMICTMQAEGVGEVAKRQFVRLFRHVPADIWRQAADRAMLECARFPVPSEFNLWIEPLWRERKRIIRRLTECREILDNPPRPSREKTPTERARDMATCVRGMLDAGMFNTPKELAPEARALMEDLADGEAADHGEDTS